MGITKQKIILPAILIGVFLIRLFKLDQSLWLDEAINVVFARSSDFGEFVTKYSQADFHPPGYFIILWIWGNLFGFSEISVRMPSVLFGVATVYLTYLIVKKIVNTKVAILAALLLALNPLHIYYSQEARMYSYAAFAVLFNIYLFISVLKKEKHSLIGFSLSLFLLLSSDYLTYFIIPSELIYLLLFKREILIKWLSATLGTVVFFAFFWLPIFISQFKVGLVAAENIPGWRNVVGSFGVDSLALTYVKFIIGRISHPDNLTYLLLFLPIGLLYGFFILKFLLSKEKDNKILLVLLTTLPILFSWAISMVVPVFSYFRVLFVLPLFIIIVSIGISLLQKKLQLIFIPIVIIVEIICIGIYFFNPQFQREDWKGLVNFLKQNNTPIIFESNNSFVPFDYYDKGDIQKIAGINNFPANKIGDVSDLEARLIKINKVYLLEYLVDVSDPQRFVQQEIESLGFRKTNSYNFHGVGLLYEYTRE